MNLLFLALLSACGPKPVDFTKLDAASNEEAAGKQLMRSPLGLNRLDAPAGESTAIVAVHGYASEGTEWVAPLQRLEDNPAAVYFYHWQDKQCPDTGSAELRAALQSLPASSPELTELVVLAHSYGGVVTALAAQAGELGLPTRVELIASPIDGVSQLQERCGFDGVPVSPPAEGVTWHQWRTQHQADGAFKDMETDPQDRVLPELGVTELPETWEDGRLGHNRSILYVTEQLDPTLQ